MARQEEKPGKDQYVQKPRKPVARMAPLSQPILQDAAQTDQRPVEAGIRLRCQKWLEPALHDEKKTGETQQVKKDEKLPPWNVPEGRIGNRVDAAHRAPPLRRLRSLCSRCLTERYIAAMTLSAVKRSFRINRRKVRRSFSILRLL